MKRVHIQLPFRLAMTLVAGIIMSTVLSLGVHTPTQALSLNVAGLTDTVTNVANNVPIVRNVTPLLMPTTQTPTVSIANPTASAQTPAAVPAVDESGPATTAQQDIALASAQQGGAPVGVALGSSTDSALLTQQEIAAAPAHVASPSVLYGSRVLSSMVATALFYSGVAGLCIGGWMMVVSRPKTNVITAGI